MVQFPHAKNRFISIVLCAACFACGSAGVAAGAAREFVHPGIAESAEDIARAERRAYDLALMYRLTDDERYAAKAVEFINANSHYESLDERGSGPLDYGKIYLLVEAAELLRLRSSGWGTLMERRLSNEK